MLAATCIFAGRVGQQLGMRPALHHCPALQHQDLITVHHCGQPARTSQLVTMMEMRVLTLRQCCGAGGGEII